jgi:dienelactone hydrolase
VSNWLDAAVSFPHAHDNWTHPVYANGTGPGVLLLHELPGMNGHFVDLATYIMQRKFRVYAPLFYGQAGRDHGPFGLLGYNEMRRYCVTHEFNMLATNGESKIANWLRDLCRRIHAECGGKGIAAIGMCFTGSVILSVMLEPAVLAPVMCEPAIPMTEWLPLVPAPPLSARQRALGVPDSDVRAAGLRARQAKVHAYRFRTDRICPGARFETLREALGAEGVVMKEFDTDGDTGTRGGAHSVFTRDRNPDPNHPTQQALDELLAYFRQVL